MAYFMIEEDRCRAHRQELVKADSYDEAFLTYCSQIVKPMREQSVAISRIPKELAKDKNAPFMYKYDGTGTFEKKMRDFYVEYKGDAVIIAAMSFDEAIQKLKDRKVKFSKFDVEIRIAEDFLIEETPRLVV